MYIQDAVEEYLGCKRNSITSKTLRWYTYHLERFCVWCKENNLTQLSEISASHVQTAISFYPTTNGYSLHGYAQVVKGFLNWCSQDEEFGVKERTIKRIELPKIEISEIHLFSDRDIDKLFRACDRVPYPYRAKAIVHILLDTGLRISELAYDGTRPDETTGLRTEAVFLGKSHEDSYIRVMGKGRKSRVIGLGNETRIALSRYIKRERGPSESPFVFLSRKDEPLSVRMLEQLITDLGELAGVKPCYPHLFRHCFAINSLLNGVSELVLMKLLGHTSLEATKVYVRAMSEIQAMKSAPSVVDTLHRSQKKGS